LTQWMTDWGFWTNGLDQFVGYKIIPYIIAMVRIRFWPKNRVRGSVPRTKGDFKKFYWVNIWDYFTTPFLFFKLMVSRHSIEVLDSENQPGPCKILTGSGALGLTVEVWHQKYENDKEGVSNYLKYLFNRILKNLDPVFGQYRILTTA